MRRRPQRVCRAPWLYPPFWYAEASRQIVQALKGVVNLNFAGEASANLVLESILKVSSDHKDNLAESGANSIIHRIIKDDLTVGAHGIELFQSAVAASHACCEYKKSWFHNTCRRCVSGILPPASS